MAPWRSDHIVRNGIDETLSRNPNTDASMTDIPRFESDPAAGAGRSQCVFRDRTGDERDRDTTNPGLDRPPPIMHTNVGTIKCRIYEYIFAMSDDNRRSSVDTSRRSLLAGVAGSATVGTIPTVTGASAGGTGTESRRSPRERRLILEARQDLEAEYEEKDLRAIVRDATTSVRAGLVDRGVLDSPAMSQFSLDPADASRVDPATFSKVRDGVGFTTTHDEQAGITSAHLLVAARTDSTEVHLHVQPELDDAYAVVVRSPGDGPGTQSAGTLAEECEDCQIRCDHAVYGAIVFGVTPPTACGDVTWECTREPTCDECPDQDKCSSGWL